MDANRYQIKSNQRMPRFHCPAPLAADELLALPAGAARHVQVLRLQPGDGLTLFNGEGGEWAATVERMGRSEVQVRVGAHDPVEREAPRTVHLVIGVPANERMDWLVEKAAELGVASIQPVIAERSVLKVQGERADRKLAHWRGVAIAACEQCGRNRVPRIHEPAPLMAWLAAAAPDAAVQRRLLSLRPGTQALAASLPPAAPLQFLSGPEGGLSAAEEDAALAAGFLPATLGPRVLRAETAPLAALVLATAG
jgi:16S rRNA (uracil1498-N3)-methyltransferase